MNIRPFQPVMQGAVDHRFVSLGDIGKVHYVAAGKGAPVVLVHPLGASVVAWRQNIPSLAERFAVFAPDLPGHGESDNPKADYDIEFGVHFLLQFFDALGLERVNLVGSSVGGLLALATALRFPERTQALVLVDAAGLGRELAWPLRLAALPGIGGFLDTLDVLAGGRFGVRIFHNAKRIDPALRQEVLRLRQLPATRRVALRALRRGVTLLGLQPSLLLLQRSPLSLRIPTLVVWGEKDRIIPVEHARRTASQAPHIRVHILSDCGHWPQMEQAEAFNHLVISFLDGSTSSP